MAPFGAVTSVSGARTSAAFTATLYKKKIMRGMVPIVASFMTKTGMNTCDRFTL